MENESTIKLEDFKYYTGDVNLEDGGLFVNLDNWKWGYAECLKITDLDSGCGFDGAVLVERLSTYMGDGKGIKRAMASSDLDHKGMHGWSTDARKMAITYALVSSGLYDLDGYGSPGTVIQCDPDGPTTFDGWKADIVLDESDDLFSYLLREGWLSDFE